MHPFWDGSTSLTGDVWIRFDNFTPTVYGGNVALLLIQNGGVNAYRIIQNTTLQVQYWNTVAGTWNNWGAAFTPTGAINQTMVLHLTLNTSFNFYVAGTIQASSAVVPTNGQATIDRIMWGAGSNSNSYSQVMIDNYNNVDSHMNSKLANANGNYTAGTGGFGDIDDPILDDSDAISLPAVTNAKTFTKAAIPAVPSGLSITGMGVNARGRVGGGVVTDGKIRIRNGSTDSDSGNKTFGASYGPRGHFFPIDPATGTTFTESGLNSTEFGALAT
jgi:hypothetical protein